MDPFFLKKVMEDYKFKVLNMSFLSISCVRFLLLAVLFNLLLFFLSSFLIHLIYIFLLFSLSLSLDCTRYECTQKIAQRSRDRLLFSLQVKLIVTRYEKRYLMALVILEQKYVFKAMLHSCYYSKFDNNC